MSFELQQTIRNNAQQLKQYCSDLYDWEQQMEFKEKAKKKQKQINKKTKQQLEEEFRLNKIEEQKRKAQQQLNEKMEKKKEMVRDINSVQDYYKAWDKYDPDDDIKRLEQEQKRAYRPYNPYEDSKNSLRAKPQTKMVVKGGRNVVKDPTSLKDKGNVHFKVCQYEKAINYYTQCIEKVLSQGGTLNQNNQKLLALVYSNRAMAYIKTNERGKALQDCNQSLKYDSEYSKTYLRRADCFKRLGKYKESLQDYRKVKELSPRDAEAEVEIKKIEQFLQRRVKETQEGMVTSIPGAVPGGYRIQIEQVQDFETQMEAQKPINYLEQL